ncbi:TetR/AcrR family transcriptional regulator [Mycolicibacterium sp.]|uniref:TetR/AcrR family transcriptional regulator n=1 Tax=Mycolicibacterium sp. TaxID=2320850 RepID=UPI0028B06F6E|nr:TetR/AcrR family transcriptional regulator [Mycolicibacterium sp.]
MQIRAAATRQLILDCAAELFDTVGYANSSLSELIAATGLSKGAFYYHFTNREAVTAAIIQEADAALQETTRECLSDPSYRALGNLIRAVFTIADLTDSNSLVRVGLELRGGLGQISAAVEGFNEHRDLFVSVAGAAIADGDLRDDLDAAKVGHTLWAAVLGTHQHCGATGEDLPTRLADVHAIVLDAICTPEAAQEYRDLVDQLIENRTPQIAR